MSAPSVSRVVVADDSMLIRQGLVSLLQLSDEVEVIGEAADVDELFAAVRSDEPHVVITDIRMPPTNTSEGIEAAVRLRSEYPDIGVVVLSQFSEPEYVMKLFQFGSDGLGYLVKERLGDLEQLEQAIRSVRSGGSAVDPKIVEIMVQSKSAHHADLIDRLTPREQEVLGLIAEGLNNSAVAERLVLSPKAVSNHINSIFSKLDLAADPESDRRVRAVLLWLAGRTG